MTRQAWNKVDRVGWVVGNLTIIEETRPDSTRTYYNCLCTCGEYREAQWQKLRQELVSACKTCTRERFVAFREQNAIKHGMYRTPLYNSWYGLKARCDNPNTRYYKYYGGRGISYDPSWSKFEDFYKDMKDTWFEGAEIDRVDPDGNYCKENCQWLTKSDHSIKTNKEKDR